MQLVRIAGPTDAMRRLGEVAGLDFERTSARQVNDGRWQVSGYATDDALDELAARELDVEPVVASDALDEQRRELYGQIERVPDEEV